MKRLFLILLLSAFSVLSFAQNPDAVQEMLKAVSLMDNGEMDDAEEILLNLSVQYPDDDAVLYYLGTCEMYQGNVKAAEESLRKAVSIDTLNYSYKERLAQLYSSTNRPELTIAIYEDLLTKYPKKVELYYRLVSLYMQTGDFTALLNTLDEIETISGKNENVALAKYDILMSQNKQEEALKMLEEYNKELSSFQILTVMGDNKLNDFEDSLALALYDEALSYEPDFSPAILGRAEVFRMRRSFNEFFSALDDFISSESAYPEEKVRYLNNIFQRSDPRFIQNFRQQLDSTIELCASIHPADSLVLQTAGSYYYNTERNDKAEQYFKKMVEVNPKSFTAWAYLTQFLAYSQNWDELIKQCEAAYSIFPDELAFLDMQTNAYYSKEDYDSVIKVCQEMVRLAPKDSAVLLGSYSTIGDMLHLKGESRKAYEYYKKALKVNPSYAPVLNNYAYYLSEERKQLKKAYEMSMKAVSQEPDNATYLDTLGWILFLQGKPQDAKIPFKRAMLYGGKDSAVSLEHYAKVLEALGENDLAKVYRNLAKDKE